MNEHGWAYCLGFGFGVVTLVVFSLAAVVAFIGYGGDWLGKRLGWKSPNGQAAVMMTFFFVALSILIACCCKGVIR